MNIPSHADETARLKRLEEASQWVQRMQEPQRRDEQVNEWLRWVDSHPDNFAEFERLQRDWEEYSILKSSSLPVAAAEVAPPVHLEDIRVNRQDKQLRRSPRSAVWAMAAGLAVIAVTFRVYHMPLSSTETAPPPLHQLTAASINRAATLPDGSKMILGTQSRLDVDFKSERRALNLAAGEAYFKVKQDRNRPFVVQAGEISVTAIGTAFDVRRGRDTIIVTVEEGIVEVAAAALAKGAAQANPATWRAEAGQQVTYSMVAGTADVTTVNSTSELRWRHSDLAYVREPLGSVVEDLNRYWRARIVIEDPEVASLPFTGTVFAASLTDWFAAIEQAYPVTVWHAKSGEVALRGRR